MTNPATESAPESALELPNGRDLGGHRTRSGATVRLGMVVRAAAPTTAASEAALVARQIATTIDLRTADERSTQPTRLPAGVEAIVADMLADAPTQGAANLGSFAGAALRGEGKMVSAADLDALFTQGYASFVTLPSARAATASVLRHLSQSQGATVLHCTAGKDRTGWASAVLLTTLGVDPDVIMTDYLASGPAVLELFAGLMERVITQGGDAAALTQALSVYPHYLEASRAAVQQNFGSWHNYLTVGLGLPEDFPEQLAEHLLH